MVSIFKLDAWLSFQERFKHTAQLFPKRCAVVDRHISITYYELDLATDHLSLELQSRQVGPNDLVVVYMSSSLEYVIACLAILKAGAAFLPIPVDLPSVQTMLILDDAQPKVILSKDQWSIQLANDHPNYDDRIMVLNEASYTYSNLTQFDKVLESKFEPVVSTAPDDYAFSTYTSGTTGKPKGVIQVQRALVMSYESRHRFNPYEDRERVACNIFFMWEILRPLLVGGTTIVIPDELIAVPKKLVSYLKAQEATEVLFTPSAFQRILRSLPETDLGESLAGIRTIWLNGEVVTTQLVREALSILPEHIKLLNTYSICECHDVSNADLKQLDLHTIQENGGICPVGYPDDGVIIRVKNERGLKRCGEGELYIGGHGLGAGYLHLEELTKERFPVLDGEPYYATGDLAYLGEDGLITIKGRLGTMVKMRGYSVYLNTIEEALRLHSEIKDARVFLRGAHLSQHLSAFLVASQTSMETWINETKQVSPQMRAWLSHHLPTYMIPSKWIRIDQFPVHPISGKLDQDALWALEQEQIVSLDELAQAPQSTWTECIHLMKRLWARALEVDVDHITVDSEFYELGGHSLSMVDLVQSVEKVFGVELDGDELYESPQLRDYLQVTLSTHPAGQEQDSVKNVPSAFTPFWDVDDFELGPDFQLELSGTRVLVSSAEHILITGATGYLGLGILEGLLNSPFVTAKLTCLVRSRQNIDPILTGQNRLIRVYQQSGLGELIPHIHSGRLSIIEGDICDEYLGLSLKEYTAYANHIDLIFHCAALVNLRAVYEQTKQSIVYGSRNILKFASRSKVKTLHHISTNSVLVASQQQPLSEDSVQYTEAHLLKDGYSQAKWVAEHLMDRAAAHGLPLTIHRPGNIGPHQQTQYANPNDLSILVWQAVAHTKMFPQLTDWSFEFTPVDIIADFVLKIANLAEPKPYYHLVHPQPIRADELFSRWYDQGWITDSAANWKRWKSELMSSTDPSLKVLATSLNYFNHLLLDKTQYSISHLQEDLPTEAQYYEQSPSLDPFFATLFLSK